MKRDKIKAYLKQLYSSNLSKNTLFYMANFSFQMVVQLGFFIVISRNLGASSYGLFASLTALSMLVGNFVGWGADRVIIQRVAVEPEKFSLFFAHGLLSGLVTLPPLFIATLIMMLFLPTEGLNLLSLCLLISADLIFTKLNGFCAACYMGFEKASRQVIFAMMTAMIRLGALLFAAFMHSPLTLELWILYYLAATILSSMIILICVLKELGRPKGMLLWSQWRLGFLYCVEFASLSGLKDLDKPVILSVLGAEAAGIYTASFRIVDAAAAPIRAILYATYARYFRHAEKSAQAGIHFGLRILPIAAFLAFIIGLGLIIIAPFLPKLLGDEYQETIILIRWLAFYPLLLGLMGIGADILRAIGWQGTRTILMLSSTLMIVPIIAFFGHYFGLEGAAIARMGVQCLLMITTWGIIGWLKKHYLKS